MMNSAEKIKMQKLWLCQNLGVEGWGGKKEKEFCAYSKSII